MTLWPWVFIAIGCAAFLGILTVAAVTFRPHRARSVLHAEAIANRKVQQQVAQVRYAHPEIVKVVRLDRHPFYVLPHVGVWCYSWCVFLGATLTSNVTALGTPTRYTMATCFLVGSTLVLIGASLGAKLGPLRIMPKVADHLTSEVLGDDVALPYRLSMSGMFAIAVAMTIYSMTSFQSTTGSLGGWLTGGLAIACIVMEPLLYHRVQTFEKWDSTLITEAMTRLGRVDAGE